MSFPIAPGGLAAVLAHPDDESFGCAGALALAHDRGATTRLLVATRGEAGTADGEIDPAFGDVREAELIGAARAIGLDEVSILDDPALSAKYVEEIPVLLINGRVHNYWRIDPVRLTTALLELT